MNNNANVIQELQDRFNASEISPQATADAIPTIWCTEQKVKDVLRYLKYQIDKPFKMLYDLTAIDERRRTNQMGQPSSDFTIVYHLLSFDRNQDVRVKVPLKGENPSIATITDLWPAANWYEREVWDMFGIRVEKHPNMRRILLPPWWQGHPLRKEHPARATEMEPFRMTDLQHSEMEETMRFRPEDWGMKRMSDDFDFMFLNIGPQHPSTHGVFRIMLQLNGQEMVDLACDIGFHHRGAEKMGERQTWHKYIPYTDRVDYLSGVLNNFAYILSVERLAGIEVPDRAKVIRIMTAELFRIISHLVYYGTFVQDLGTMSPVFYMFTDREHAFDIVEAIMGARMHPNWFRIGGVAQDLPQGWEKLITDFLEYLPKRLDEYDRMVMKNRIFKARTQGVGQISVEEAIEWGATGPMIRGCGLAWDMRKKRPYGGYDQFEFDIPTGSHGDCYDRMVVHVEEIRQSLRIIEQCVRNMPSGPCKADHPQTTPPIKEHTMHDIETLIDHFLNVSWGPVIPAGEASVAIESSKGINSYYLISDENTSSYRTRIRTPSFPHIQMVPLMSRGLSISDLVAIMGSIDFVLADVDR